jgi:hypothetical protein
VASYFKQNRRRAFNKARRRQSGPLQANQGLVACVLSQVQQVYLSLRQR